MDYKTHFKQYKKYNIWIADKCLEKTKLVKQQLENRIPSVKAQIITDMPTMHSNESTVERFVVKSEELEQELKIKIDLIQAEIDEYTAEIQAIDSRLAYLTSEQRFILEQYYIKELSWELISKVHQAKFQKNSALQVQSLIDIRNKAIQILDEIQ